MPKLPWESPRGIFRKQLTNGMLPVIALGGGVEASEQLNKMGLRPYYRFSHPLFPLLIKQCKKNSP